MSPVLTDGDTLTDSQADAGSGPRATPCPGASSNPNRLVNGTTSCSSGRPAGARPSGEDVSSSTAASNRNASIGPAAPSRRTVSVYRSRSDIRILGEGEVLEGGEVLPGLRNVK